MLREGTKLNGITPSLTIAPIIPQSFDDALRIARLALKAGLYQSKGTDDEREAQATMAILKGMEIGLPPMQSLEGISIINGRSCIWGDLVPALLWSKGFELDEYFENELNPENLTAVCTVTRPNGKKITRKFSVPDAIQAGLWGQAGVWTKYGKPRMLPMRARGYASRDGAADVLKGLYMREEMEDMLRAESARDITPERSPMIPTKEFLDVPSAPIDEKPAPKEEPKLAEAGQAEKSEDLLGELRIALEGAKTDEEAYDAWDELAERISLCGWATRESGQAILEKHIAALPKLIEAKQEIPAAAFIPTEAAAFDMASVPAAE